MNEEKARKQRKLFEYFFQLDFENEATLDRFFEHLHDE